MYFGLLVLALVFAGAVWGMYAGGSGSCDVTLSIWDRTVSLRTAKNSTVAKVLETANVVLFPGDLCVPGPDEIVCEGASVTVSRAKPVFVKADGRVFPVMTAETEVSKVLALAELVPDETDEVTPGIQEHIGESNMVQVVRISYATVTENLPIGFATETRPDDSLETGITKVYRSGSPGLAHVTYEVKYEDGNELERIETGRRTVEEPVSKIVLVGTIKQVSRSGENLRFSKVVEAVVTAYCPCQICCGKYANGFTHTGLPAKKGVVAVDPSVIPLGSRVYVDGYGYAIAADTGGAIKGTRVDVCFDTHAEALAWGMQKAKVFLLE